MSDQIKTTITQEQWDHFQRLAKEDHDMQTAEIERLRAALKGYEIMLTHFENVFLEA